MEVKPTINLIFFSVFPKKEKITSYKLSFTDNIHKIDSCPVTHEIPEIVFKYGKDKASISLDLFNSFNTKLNTIDYKVNYGENNIYLENEGNGKGYCFDMIFKNCQNLNVKNSEIEFNSFDSNGTKDRKKLTILNYNLLSIEVNSIEININKEIEQIPSSDFY